MQLDYPDPPLSSPRLVLRRWSHDDLPCVEEASTDPEIPRGTTVPAAYSPEAGRQWIERQWARQTSGQGLSLAVENVETGTAVGLVFLGLRQPEGHCELGYWLVPSARGRRLGPEAVRLASRWVLTQTTVYRLFALVAPENTASMSVMTNCGFTREGTLRSYLRLRYPDQTLDVVSYSLLESDL
jgi:RimJ/RimL family protein N-acetyltransferase